MRNVKTWISYGETVFVCFSVQNRYYIDSHQTRFILVGSDVNEMHVSFTKQKNGEVIYNPNVLGLWFLCAQRGMQLLGSSSASP